MFAPADFLQIATQMVGDAQREPRAETNAARARTALGRAYYALYLLVRSELVRRHGVSVRSLQHGAVYTRLQSPRASDEVRQLGRDLQLLYTLRQKADYEMDPAPSWKKQLEDPEGAEVLVRRARDLARSIPHLDFSSVVSLLDPRG